MLYSYNGNTPSPLPFRIKLSNGFTRTDPTTFTEEEIADAGYSGPYTEPAYDPSTESIAWINGHYKIDPIEPLQREPDWATFKAGWLVSSDVAQVMSTARSLGCEPSASALPVALEAAREGNVSDFAVCWQLVASAGGATTDAIAQLVDSAKACDLPIEFIEALVPKIE